LQSKSKINIEKIPCGYLATNLASEITAMNSILCDWLKLNQQELIGQHIKVLLPMSSQLLFLGNILPSLQLNKTVEENYLKFKVRDDENLPLMVNAQRINHDGKPYYSYALMKMHRRHLIEKQLIQERRRAEMATEEKAAINLELQLAQAQLLEKQQSLMALNQELKALSTTDALTGLFNRRVYDQELDKQIARYERQQEPFCLVLLDIDFFKKINDQHGHDTGDAVLKQFAQLLQSNLREVDTLSRIGGEEFTIILPNTRVENAKEVAERHRQTIEATEFDCGRVTASFGITEMKEGLDKTDLYTQADAALYLSKVTGRNQVSTT